MKKAISIFLCVMLLLSFSGCSNKVKKEEINKVKYPIIPQSIELPQNKTNYHFYASQNGYFYKNDGTNSFSELIFASIDKEDKIYEFADALTTHTHLYVSNGKNPNF